MKYRSREFTRPTVTKPIVIVGLEGQVLVESICIHMLQNVDHILEYSHDTEHLLVFDFHSTLREDGQTYLIRGTGTGHGSNTILQNGRMWRHLGKTNSNASKPQQGMAEIIGLDKDKVGSCEITYSVYPDLPKAKKYANKSITVPLT